MAKRDRERKIEKDRENVQMVARENLVQKFVNQVEKDFIVFYSQLTPVPICICQLPGS